MKILFVNKTDRVEFAKYLRATLRKWYPGISLVATDIHRESPMRFVSDSFALVPDSTSRRFTERILAIVEEHNIAGLFAASNFDLSPINALRKQLRKSGVRVLCPPNSVIRATLDKRKYPDLLRPLGIANPRIFAIDAGERPKFPCLVKPSCAQGSQSVYFVRSASHLSHTLPLIVNPVVQEIIQGEPFTIDMFGNEKGEPICIVPRRRTRIAHSRSVLSTIDLNPSLIHLGSELGTTLHIPGPYNIQVILDRKSCAYVHDINPRIASGAVLTMRAGAPFARWIADLLTTGRATKYNFDIRNGASMFAYETLVYRAR